MNSLSATAKFTLKFINQTNKSVFLTGKAGTGKTTLLKQIINTTHKNTAVVAPTGIAALNAGGVTIHSLFQLPFGGFRRRRRKAGCDHPMICRGRPADGRKRRICPPDGSQ